MLDVIHGDALATLRQLPDCSVDSVLTDPPYGLSKEPDPAEMLRHWLAPELREHAARIVGPERALELYPEQNYQHGGKGFMGKSWDSFVPGPEVWREVVRVLKPGGHALVFGGTRTYDLLVLALRLARFQVRDMLAWIYGSGFPKSRDISKDIDERAGAVGKQGPLKRGGERLIGHAERDGEGRWGDESGRNAYTYAPATPDAIRHAGKGTALKPAIEPVALVRKNPDGTIAACVLEHGTGGINVDACRIGDSDTRRAHNGLRSGVSLNSAHDGSMQGVAGVTDTEGGRWPANVLFDEEAAAILDEQAGPRKSGSMRAGTYVQTSKVSLNLGLNKSRKLQADIVGSEGGASRFFYCAKTPTREREAGLAHLPLLSGGQATGREEGTAGLSSPRAGAGRGGGRHNPHPTVKPLELLRYLVRLITPAGGTVLVPFAGSGSEVIAAGLEGFHALGIEQSEEYTALAWARIGHHCERAELAERARGWYASRAA